MIQRIQEPHLTGFRFEQEVAVLSSAVLGGGLGRCRSIINLAVEKDYQGHDPAADLLAAARALALPGPTVGLMTAVPMDRAAALSAEGLHVLVTAGVTNAERAGVTPPWRGPAEAAAGGLLPGPLPPGPGTINIIAVLERQVPPAALCGALITMTEAKVRALSDLGIRTPDQGLPATGTTSDAAAVAATGTGPACPFLGPGTVDGYRLAQLVYRAVAASLQAG